VSGLEPWLEDLEMAAKIFTWCSMKAWGDALDPAGEFGVSF